MEDFKRWCGLTFFAIIISVFYAVENIDEYLLKFINSYFVFALFFLTIGCFMYVLDSGFFRNFTTAYRKMMRNSFSKQSHFEDDIRKTGPDFLYTWPLIWSGVTGFILTLIISLTFF